MWENNLRNASMKLKQDISSYTKEIELSRAFVDGSPHVLTALARLLYQISLLYEEIDI